MLETWKYGNILDVTTEQFVLSRLDSANLMNVNLATKDIKS
jgi:hypothetical protein